MRLTKENVYINLRGKTKDELTELYYFLKSVGEKLYADNLTWFLEYSNSKNNVFVFHYNKRVWLNPKREYVTNKQEVTIEQLKEILQPMETFRPIAMRCTQEQFEAIKPKLKGVNIYDVDFYNFICNSYLTNNLAGKNYVVSNISELCKRDYSREVHEEWNEEIFLETCGIEVGTLQDRLANLEKEIEEVKALIEEENKPKIGDVCKFWDNGENDFIIGKLECVDGTEIYPYEVHGVGFENCEKITDENFLKVFNNL